MPLDWALLAGIPATMVAIVMAQEIQKRIERSSINDGNKWYRRRTRLRAGKFGLKRRWMIITHSKKPLPTMPVPPPPCPHCSADATDVRDFGAVRVDEVTYQPLPDDSDHHGEANDTASAMTGPTTQPPPVVSGDGMPPNIGAVKLLVTYNDTGHVNSLSISLPSTPYPASQPGQTPTRPFGSPRVSVQGVPYTHSDAATAAPAGSPKIDAIHSRLGSLHSREGSFVPAQASGYVRPRVENIIPRRGGTGSVTSGRTRSIEGRRPGRPGSITFDWATGSHGKAYA